MFPGSMKWKPHRCIWAWMTVMGFIDRGAFELLLGGVSHITHKALVLIAALSARTECLSLVMDGGGVRGGRWVKFVRITIANCNPPTLG